MNSNGRNPPQRTPGSDDRSGGEATAQAQRRLQQVQDQLDDASADAPEADDSPPPFMQAGARAPRRTASPAYRQAG